MRIFHGISAVSLQSTRYLIDALRSKGHTADSVVYRNNGPLFDMEDVNLNMNLRKYWLYPVYVIRVLRLFIHAVRKYDVFHFHFGHSLMPLNMDMWLLKVIFHKKVYMEYHGTDIRYIFNEAGTAQMEQSIDEEKRKKSFKLQKRVARNADGIIIHDYELSRNLFEANVPVYMVPLRVDLSRFHVDAKESGSRVTIVHAPSHRGKKGTEYVMAVMSKIRQEFDVEFELVEKMSYAEAMAVYRKADIVIDQLLIGAYGMLAIESMAQGKTVVCYIEDEDKAFHTGVCPLCNADAFNLHDRLTALISNKTLRNEYSVLAREYVEMYHDSRKCADQLLEIYGKSRATDE